jgi:hypothetical protein
MPTTKTLTGEGLVRKLVGIGFAIVKLDDDGKRGECKAYAGDHVCEVTTKRPAKYGDIEFDILKSELDPPGEQVEVTRICRFVLTPDAAESLGVTLGDAATGADAAGTWTPEGSTPPENLGAMEGVVANPTTPWTDGQHVVLDDGSTAYWNGAAWVAGMAPGTPIVATGATAGTPGTFTPSGATTPADLAGLAAITATPPTPWTTGQHVILGDASHASWDGVAWVAGDGVAVAGLSAQTAKEKVYESGKSKILQTK